MTRKEIMLLIMELNNFFLDTMNESERFGKNAFKKKPEFTPSWLDEKFDRFYLVETSCHRGEEFSVDIELRYGLRSQEAFAYGKGNSAFYDRYISTSAMDIKYLKDPEAYREMIRKELEVKTEEA